jgi:hypothetical protein
VTRRIGRGADALYATPEILLPSDSSGDDDGYKILKEKIGSEEILGKEDREKNRGKEVLEQKEIYAQILTLRGQERRDRDARDEEG